MHPVSDTGIKEKHFRADLHCHTTSSDGSLDPIELIDLALEMGLSALSITDHDTVDAYKTAVPYALEKKLLLGTGVEFSCEFKNQSIHVLGYDFSLENDSFLEYCLRQQQKRLQRNREILAKLHRMHIAVDENDLFSLHEKASTIGRPHIAAAMVNKGYVRSIQEAFQIYLGDNKSCFVPGDPFPVAEAIEIIHKAGGKAFIAHPHMYQNFYLIKEVLTLPFDGIECYYGRAHLDKVKRWKKVASQKGILMSGGSDFHGEAKPHISLGVAWVDQEIFNSIFEKNLIR